MPFFHSMKRSGFDSRNLLRRLIALVVLSSVITLLSAPCYASESGTSTSSPDESTDITVASDSIVPVNPNEPIITASAEQVYVFSTNRGATLYRTSDSEPRIIPATSKLMTVVIALETLPSDTVITISEDVEELDNRSSKPINIKKGAKYTVSFLVSAILYRNSDAAVLSLAEYISNDESDFVDKMNGMAKTLSMKSTNFVNTSGVESLSGLSSDIPYPSGSRQFSTVEDLAILFRYALNLSGFREIFSDYNAIEFQDTSHPLSISSMIISAWGIEHVLGAQYFPDATGTTGNSCLLALASDDSFEIGIILTDFTDSNKYVDLKQTVGAIFDFYEVSNLIEAGDAYRFIEIDGLEEPVSAIFKNSIMYIHPAGKYYSIPESNFTPSKALSLPIRKGDTLGQVEIVLEDGTHIVTEVVAENDVSVRTNLITEMQTLLDSNRNISVLILISVFCLLILAVRRVVILIRRAEKRAKHI